MQRSEPGCGRRFLATGLRIALALAAALATVRVAQAAAPFVPDNQPDGWVTRPALTSYNLSAGNQVMFQAQYRIGPWSGALYANHLDATGQATGTTPWADANAAVLLDAQSWDSGRRIVTRNATGSAVALRWSQLSPSQQALLGDATTGPRLLNYVRGERSYEYPHAAGLRERSSVLGDIQHSTLLYWNHGSGRQRLYVGANDGLLHVFDAATGAEVFAYVPSMLLGRLPKLAARPYAHTLYVDGGLALSDVVQANGSSRTWLAGALGGGGKGLFMLDVTDPAAADEASAAAKLKWEITPASSGFANLGHSYAAPRIVRLNNGTPAVIVGNGYNNGGNGQASLLVIDADTGTLIREIGTGSGTIASPNGLSTATPVDSNGDGKVDLVYAGDLEGNLWRFDLSASAPSAYTATRLMTTAPAQAITVPPVIVPHVAGGRLAVFATGRMLSSADASDTAAHAVYGFWDGAPAGSSTWLTQTLTTSSLGSQGVRLASTNRANWAAGGHIGWKVALPAGERVVGEAPFANLDRYYFVSSNPTVAAAGSGRPAGSSWITELDFGTGGSTDYPVFDLNGDNQIDGNDLVDGRVVAARQLGPGIFSQAVLVDLATRSRTLFNWQSGVPVTPTGAAPSDPGVSGGHFDVDLYHPRNGRFMNVKHVHEYDDKYDVTGVNFLAASNSAFNLSNAIPDAGVGFKVLVANQYLNPAVRLSVGGADWVPVRGYGQLATATDAAALLASLPGYSRASIGTLAFKLPLDGFASKDWWGDGTAPRVGLIPTQTGCVNKVASDGSTLTLGPNGERHDGALTIQLIRADTPASALELNHPAGGAKYGWRVKLANFGYVLAEYTVFWHHPNGKCYGNAGWAADAPQDLSPASTASVPRSAGSSDPTDGIFSASVPAGVSVVSVTTTVAANVSTTTTLYSDGLRDISSVRDNGDGTETVTSSDRSGQTTSNTRIVGGATVRGSVEVLSGTRRLNWRELVRQ